MQCMSNNVFKLKLKFQENTELIETIKSLAKQLDLYDPKFDEDSQGGGYHGFKQLCLLKQNLPDDVGVYKDIGSAHLHPGYFQIARIHPLMRHKVFEVAREIRDYYKIQPK
jgi:hypothetical protein